MTFDAQLDEFRRVFRNSGEFTYTLGQRLAVAIRNAHVPSQPGVYVIHARPGCEVLYIGRAGTMHNNGSFGAQMLDGRLQAKQGGVRREQFYQERMGEQGLAGLRFLWFVTFSEDARVLPAKAEADLLQAFFDEHGELPMWNHSL